MAQRKDKKIIALVIAAVLLGHTVATYVPTARAIFGIGDIVTDIKAWFDRIDTVLGSTVGKIAAQEVARMVRTLIIHARGGGPAFVTNWRNYSRKNQNAGANIARNLIGEAAYGVGGDPATATMCSFFHDTIGENLNANQVDQAFSDISRAFRLDDAGTFKLLTRCTVPSTIIVGGTAKPFSIASFQDSFEGGWTVFEKLLEPQNNFFGAMAISQAEVERQRDAQKESTRDEAISGGGFLSTVTTSGQIRTPGKLLGDVTGITSANTLQCLNNVISFSSLGVCVADVVRNSLTNFRNIADTVGLLDDETSDDGDAGNPTPGPTIGPQVCEEACAESSQAICEVDPTVVDFITYQVCFDRTYDECIADMCQTP